MKYGSALMEKGMGMERSGEEWRGGSQEERCFPFAGREESAVAYTTLASGGKGIQMGLCYF